MPNYKNIYVDNKRLPYINNKTLAASGFFSRKRNQNPHFLNALPVDVLRMIFDKLSGQELKALAETSSEFIKEMMTASSQAINGFRYPVGSYPYLQEIYISSFVSYLQKKGVFDAFLSKFHKQSDEERGVSDEQVLEQALSRIIHLDNPTIEAGISYYKRETLIGRFSPGYKLGSNGEAIIGERGSNLFVLFLLSFVAGVTLFLVFIIMVGGNALDNELNGESTDVNSIFPMGYVGLGLLAFGCLGCWFPDLLRKTNPFKTIENNQIEEADILELDADLALGINSEEESEAQDDDDDLLSVRREATARFDLRDDNDYHPSETSPLLRRY